jgi:hypothetical protein
MDGNHERHLHDREGLRLPARYRNASLFTTKGIFAGSPP